MGLNEWPKQVVRKRVVSLYIVVLYKVLLSFFYNYSLSEQIKLLCSSYMFERTNVWKRLHSSLCSSYLFIQDKIGYLGFLLVHVQIQTFSNWSWFDKNTVWKSSRSTRWFNWCIVEAYNNTSNVVCASFPHSLLGQPFRCLFGIRDGPNHRNCILIRNTRCFKHHHSFPYSYMCTHHRNPYIQIYLHAYTSICMGYMHATYIRKKVDWVKRKTMFWPGL